MGSLARIALAVSLIAAGPSFSTPDGGLPARLVPPELKGLPLVVVEAALAVPPGKTTFCATGDAWENFVVAPKSPAVVAALVAWAETPGEPDANVTRAVEALSMERDPALLAFWKRTLSRTPIRSLHRQRALMGLLRLGEPGVEVAWPLLGEDDARDRLIVEAALAPPHGRRWLEKARAVAERPGASAQVRSLVLNRSLSLTAGEPNAEREALIASPRAHLAWLAISTAEPSARTLRLALESARADRPPQERASLVWALGTLLGDTLDRPTAEAEALAVDWVASTEPTLSHPVIRLSLARWRLSRGDRRGAERVLSSALASAPEHWRREFAKTGKTVDASAVEYARAELALTCLLEASGQRAGARKHFTALSASAKVLRVSPELANAFFAKVAGECRFSALEAVLAQPLLVSSSSGESDGGVVELTLTVSNQGQTPASISVCTRPEGPLPRGRYTIRGSAPMEVDCASPVSRVVASRETLVARIRTSNAAGAPQSWSSWTPPEGPTFWTTSE